MQELYPFRFQPIFRQYIWGGRRLQTYLNKQIGDGEDYAESWEIVDHGEDQSIVANGSLCGMSLGEIVKDRATELLGEKVAAQISAENVPEKLKGRFPLLLKFLDANRNLSVQVHPNDAQGSLLSPPDLGKTEAWYVMASDPGAKIFAGLKEGVSKSDFEDAIKSGRVEETLNAFEPKVGDCIFIPAGTVHALGEGIVIAEIQQSSDTTFRVFDWNRVGADGKSRPLHIEQSLDVINFEKGPVSPINQADNARNIESLELVSCDKFTIELHQLNRPKDYTSNGCFRILAMIDGEATISADPSQKPLSKGETILIPASLEIVSSPN